MEPLSSTRKPVADLLAKEMIPAHDSEVRNSLAWLQWIVWEALGLCWVMSSSKRYTTSEIVAAHLYAQGAAIPPEKRLKPPPIDLQGLTGCVGFLWVLHFLHFMPHYVSSLMR